MTITVELPDSVVSKPDAGRLALEALAIAGYRSGALTSFQFARLLGLARLEVDDFLVGHGVEEHAYDMADLDRDREAVREFRREELLHP